MKTNYADMNPETIAQQRPGHECDEEWIREFLVKTQIGHVSTHWDQQPFVKPTLYWYDVERNVIYLHTNYFGRFRANCENYPEVCFEACVAGELLPANTALEFGLQFESVVVFGKIKVIEDQEQCKRALYGLIKKYFPDMVAGDDYRPITDAELKRTCVYAIKIESWSGKRNWKEHAKQSSAWKTLKKKSS